MKLTPFGELARQLRMKNGLTLKSMAEAMGISSAHLSSIEFGEKKLNDKHTQSALDYFSVLCSPEQLGALRTAADMSKDFVSTEALNGDAKHLVAAFARRLQEGATPSDEFTRWLSELDKTGDSRK
ncbi:helix-turn-helix domain-containing protein [Thauera humireducens]|uniref:HTH cro/C1-type domain-containing protein n=1 Tax=Thauera humireducens TaxID=1134435 RepID=A0A127K381_9RHOO|nr:helix-turn-helix transcriptional regulator [Thauera humireducens]AMO36421.1 hypothetical protein AC731_005410 [Thauera humireducens]